MATVTRFEELDAWKKARVLAKEVHFRCTREPARKDTVFRSQICRAAISAMTNISEGFARRTDKDFAHFLDIAKASAVEVQSLLYFASDVGYVDENEFKTLYGLAAETMLMTGAFAAYLRKCEAERKSKGTDKS